MGESILRESYFIMYLFIQGANIFTCMHTTDQMRNEGKKLLRC